jgi:hypothetical protein
MVQVLQTWKKESDKVKLSGWLSRFGRNADTNATNQVITLPPGEAKTPRDKLAMTLIHESAHGTKREIIDNFYSGSIGSRRCRGRTGRLTHPITTSL